MASVKDCVERMVSEGKITRALADEALGFHKRSHAQFSMQTGPASAEALAANETINWASKKSAREQYKTSLAIKAFDEGEKRLKGHFANTQALMGQLTKDPTVMSPKLDALRKEDPTNPVFTGGNADYKADVIEHQMYAMLGPEMEKMKTGLIPDIKKITGSENFIRESKGVNTGDPIAKAISDGFKKAIAYGTERVKAAGKDFKELENWDVFQHWTPYQVARAPVDQYVKDYMKEIAEGGVKLFDKETGTYARASKYEEIIRRAHSDIKTEGGTTGPFSQDVRTFEFQPGEAGAKSWLALQKKYGVGNEIMQAVQGHITHMAREIALYEQFGPYPDATFKALLRQVKDNPTYPVKGKVLDFMTSPRAIQLTYDQLTGKGSPGPVGSEFGARLMSGARSLAGASALRNLLPTIMPGDMAMTLLAAKYIGMDGVKILHEVFNSPLSKADALHLLVQSHSYMDYTLNTVRKYEDRLNISGLMQRVSRGVVKATGADWWTTNGRQGFASSVLNQLAGESRKSFDRLDPNLRSNLFQKHGFTDQDWDKIRETPHWVVGGAHYIDPTANGALGERLMMAIREESSYAFHEPDVRTQAIMRQGSQRGTLPGELWRSVGQYKQFTMERMTTHLMRTLTEGPMENRVMRGAAFMIGSIAAGAVSLQAAAIASGKSPMDMANPRFWLQAFTKGGAGGLGGDMMSAGLFGGRDTSSMLGQMLGPVPSLATDTFNLAAAPARQTIDQKGQLTPEQTFEDRAIAMGRRWTPSTFYTKTATDRLVWDKLQMLFDSHYRSSFQRLADDAARHGQTFLWRPGQTTPNFLQ